VVNVAVGSPAASVPSEVESDSHEGNAWVGAVMNGCQTDTDGRGESIERVLEGAGMGAVGVRSCCSERTKNVKKERERDREGKIVNES
jgi:hypothetical protein